MNNGSHSSRNGILRYGALSLWAIFALFPIYWMMITSLKRPIDIFRQPAYLPGVDFEPSLLGWRYITSDGRDAFLTGLTNSVLFASVSALIAVIIGAFAAYGLARYKYNYGPLKNDDLAFMIVSQRMMPPIVAVIALFMIYRSVGLLDTRVGMIIVYTWYNLPITVYLLTDFMRRIPQDIEHAAALDGYGKFGQIWKVMIPLAMPGLAAAYLLAFIFAWNDFLLALMLTFRDAPTLPIVIAAWSAKMEPRWFLLSAAGLIAIIPPIVAEIVLDRYMERQVLRGGTR
jgi:multiple sugar transport system permease protein